MIYFVESSQSMDYCKTIDDPNRSASSNISCRFPFVYKGVEYNDCVWDDKGAWCSTKTNNQNNHKNTITISLINSFEEIKKSFLKVW